MIIHHLTIWSPVKMSVLWLWCFFRRITVIPRLNANLLKIHDLEMTIFHLDFQFLPCTSYAKSCWCDILKIPAPLFDCWGQIDMNKLKTEWGNAGDDRNYAQFIFAPLLISLFWDFWSGENLVENKGKKQNKDHYQLFTIVS